MNAYMHEKEEREGKCYLKLVVPVVIRLGQALLPHVKNVEFQGTYL